MQQTIVSNVCDDEAPSWHARRHYPWRDRGDMKQIAITRAGILLAFTLFCTESVRAAAQTSIPEEIEWTWELRPAHPNSALPNVLLIGDSITRAYYSTVADKLATQ